MIRKLIFTIISLSILSALTGCNSDSPDDSAANPITHSSAAVTAFSLQENDKVLANLDSVRFSINLHECTIYNADSLPKGTRINKLQVNIAANNLSVAEITYRTKEGKDSVVDYLKSTSDTIDFSRGPVQLRVVSGDKTTTCVYSIKVNVHQMEPDSLYWSKSARKSLPSIYNVPSAQKTIEKGGKLYCLTTNGEKYCVAMTNHPDQEWEKREIAFEFTPNVETFATDGTDLYLLDDAGNLFKSDDEGESWTAQSGYKWMSVIGGYDGKVLGVERSGNDYYYTSYPDGEKTLAPEGFPVTGFSGLYIYSTKWSESRTAIMVGGRGKNAKSIDRTWAYDGKHWADITTDRRVCAAEGMNIVKFYKCSLDTTNWTYKSDEVLLAFGGNKGDEMNGVTYMSKDLGFNWRQAGTLMNLPDYIPGRYLSDSFVYERVIAPDARGCEEWQEMPEIYLPAWYVPESALSRAVSEVTQWNTPYIYIFGGYNATHTLYNTVWRGTIGRLEFKPVQ